MKSSFTANPCNNCGQPWGENEVYGYCFKCFKKTHPYSTIGNILLVIVYNAYSYDFEPGIYGEEESRSYWVYAIPAVNWRKMYCHIGGIGKAIKNNSIPIGNERTLTRKLQKQELMKTIQKEALSDTTLSKRILALKMK